MDLLRFTTAGSVDDGKSTLIGRLLYDSKAIFEDQLEAMETSSKARGDENVNLALLTDGLRAEREQGITIDVAYRYFATPKRKFIIADTPGHIQYTRNMVTGASTANLAIVLIDARKGVIEQTCRHSFIANLLRIQHVVVCVNKMDLVDWSEGVFNKIVDEFKSFASRLDNIVDVTFIPASALIGDNIVDKSKNMPWYKGPPLLYHLENVYVGSDSNHVDSRFPVQWVIRPHSDEYHDFRGFSGRVAGGVFKVGDEVTILPSGFSTKIKKILKGNEEIDEAFAGDIVALAGLKETTTGDTLCDVVNSVVLETMSFPDPVIEIAVEPKSKNDQEKMSAGLARLAAEDPSFRVSTDLESGQTIMKGMGELHLDILIDRLKREFKVEANIGAPQVAYRETITKEVEVDYTHKKQSGGAGQFARIKMIFTPDKEDGYSFKNSVVGGNVPKEYIPGVEKGIKIQKETGVVAGFPVIDFKAELVDGASHDVDSSVLAFEIAARAAFREAMNKAAAKLLEPIMKVEVVTPEEYMGDIIGDLNSRRGNVGGMDQRGNARVIDCMVPLANMFGYVNTLRSMSQGRAQFTMQFDHYDQVPQAVADEVIAKMA